MAQLPSEDRTNQYTATAGQTTFIYDFQIYTDAEIKVQQGDDTLTLTTDYTVTDAGEEDGGTVILVTGAAADDTITITGNTIVERSTTFTQGGAWNAADVNGEYDRIDNLISELVSEMELSLRLGASSSGVSLTIPEPVADRALVWNDDGTALENSEYDPDTAQEAAASATISAANAAASETAAANSADSASDSADAAADSAASIDLSALNTDILPDVDGVRDLGSTSKRFSEIWVDNIAVRNDIDAAGDITAATFNGSALPTNTTAHFRYSVAYNVDGGTYSTSGTWQTRPINTEVSDDVGITLSANALTIPSGIYSFTCSCTFSSTDYTFFRLQQTSATATTLAQSVQTYNSSYGNECTFSGVFELDASATVEVQMVATNSTSNGMGEATNNSSIGNNIYLDLTLMRIN